MPHRRFRGLKQVPLPNPCYGERKEHPLREARPPPPPSLIVAGNLWGRPVSQVLETDDVRPLIGCLHRRRHQAAARAAGTESRTRGDGRIGGGRWGRAGEMRTRWVREVVWRRNAKAERWGGHGKGLLMSRETALCWRSLRGWQSLLNTNPWELGSAGGEETPVHLQLAELGTRSEGQWGGRMMRGLCGTERRIFWF